MTKSKLQPGDPVERYCSYLRQWRPGVVIAREPDGILVVQIENGRVPERIPESSLILRDKRQGGLFD